MRDLLPAAPEKAPSGPLSEYYREEAEFKELLQMRLEGNMPSVNYYRGGVALETARGVSKAAIKSVKGTTSASVMDILKTYQPSVVVVRPPECDRLDTLLQVADLQRISAEQIMEIIELYASIKKGLKGSSTGTEKKDRKMTLQTHKEAVDFLTVFYPLRKLYEDVEFYNRGINEICAKFEGKPFFNAPDIQTVNMIIDTSVEDAKKRYTELLDEEQKLSPLVRDLPLTKKLTNKLRVANNHQSRLKARIDCVIFTSELSRIEDELQACEKVSEGTSGGKLTSNELLDNKIAVCTRNMEAINHMAQMLPDLKQAGDYHGKFKKQLARVERLISSMNIMPIILGRRKSVDDFLHLADHFLCLYDYIQSNDMYKQFSRLPSKSYFDTMYVQFRHGVKEFSDKWTPIYRQGANPYEIFSQEFFEDIRSQGEKSLFITLSKLEKLTVHAHNLQMLLTTAIIHTTESANHSELKWIEKQNNNIQNLIRALDTVNEIFRSTLL